MERERAAEEELTRQLHERLAATSQPPGADGLQANLAYASADARRVINSISKSKHYTSVRSKLLVEQDATQQSIVSAIDGLVAEGSSNDTIVVFFASHGIIDQNGTLRIALSTTSRSSIEGTALSFDQIASSLQKARSRVIVLLDVCHAGASANGWLCQRAFLLPPCLTVHAPPGRY